jgi:hypothetical protein
VEGEACMRLDDATRLSNLEMVLAIIAFACAVVWALS